MGRNFFGGGKGGELPKTFIRGGQLTPLDTMLLFVGCNKFSMPKLKDPSLGERRGACPSGCLLKCLIIINIYCM